MIVGKTCIGNMHNIFKIYNQRVYHKVIRKRKVPNCLLENLGTTASAVICKNFGIMLTYPLDSCRIYSQVGHKWSHIHELYRGYWTVLSTQTVQSTFSYLAFFSILNMVTLTYHKPIHEAVVFATIASSLITSFVKVPLTFINRNIIFYQECNAFTSILSIVQKLTPHVYKRCWLTVIISDIPETIIKTFLNFVVLYYCPSIDHLTRNCVISLSTNLFIAPFDYILTHAFCKVCKARFNILNCFDGIQYKLSSCLMGQIVFFHAFNFLQPSKFY